MRILLFLCLFVSPFVSAATYKVKSLNFFPDKIGTTFSDYSSLSSALKGYCQKDRWGGSMKIISVVEFSPSGSGYFRVEYNSYGSNPDCSGKGSYPAYGTDFYPTESGQYEMLANYCDSEQYHSDLKNQERSCLLSASPNQDASFKGWCNKDSQKLEYTCKLTDKPVEPNTCPDGSKPNADGSCGDSGGTGGGDSGGDGGGTEGGGSGGDGGGTEGGGSGGDKTDLSSVISAINSANTDIVNSQSSLSSLLNSANSLSREQMIKMDRTNNALSNIANITSGLDDSINSSTKNQFDRNISAINNMSNKMGDDFERAMAEMKKNSAKFDEQLKLKREEAEKRQQQVDNQNKQIDNQKQTLDKMDSIKESIDTASNLNDKNLQSLNSNVSSAVSSLDDISKGIDGVSSAIGTLGDKISGLDGSLSGMAGNLDKIANSHLNAGKSCLSEITTCTPFYVPSAGSFTDAMEASFNKLRNMSGVDSFIEQFKFEGNGNSSIPVWKLDLSAAGWGVFDISIDAYIWQFLRACILFGAAISCRKIIFGG
ncbi:hypothetical protein QMU85_003665 [Photobacterium damselae]|nr:hypothetical protein [Photobacterium damselae]